MGTGWDKGGKVLNWLGKTLDNATKQLLFQAFRKYVENYEQRHGILKVLGMREPVSLESIYTQVQLLSDCEIADFAWTAKLKCCEI